MTTVQQKIKLAMALLNDNVCTAKYIDVVVMFLSPMIAILNHEVWFCGEPDGTWNEIACISV